MSSDSSVTAPILSNMWEQAGTSGYGSCPGVGEAAATSTLGVKMQEDFRAVSFHDVEYSVHSLLTRKTKKILNGIRYS